jgi:hypothetical protein
MCNIISAQKKEYAFDYLIEYKSNIYKDSIMKTEKRYYLTNSKDNSYSALIFEKDSLTFEIVFRDYNKKQAKFYLNKIDFFKAEYLTVDKSLVNTFNTKDQYNHLIKKYDFITLKDTIIGNESYYHYALKSNNPKRTKRKKIGELHHIINKNTAFHKPILKNPTAYAEWKTKPNAIPNGIFKLVYKMSYDKKIVVIKHLNKYIAVDKKIVLLD